MSEKESITTLLTLLDARQARLAAACKEIADWVDHQGGHPTALRIRDRLHDLRGHRRRGGYRIHREQPAARRQSSAREVP